MTTTDSQHRALSCARHALEKKAYDLAIFEVGALTSLADYFLVCTGRSDTQVQAIAQSIEENMAKAGVRPLSTEGAGRGHWIILDFGDVVVHVFYEPVREFYDLGRLWGHAPRLALPEPLSTQARDLRLVDAAS